MNYSRATTPTPANKPGVDKRIDDKMEILLEQQKVLEEAIAHYSKKMALKDFWYDWYSNSLTHYQNKYEKLMREIANTSGVAYHEPTKEVEADKTVARIREITTPAEEKAVGTKKS